MAGEPPRFHGGASIPKQHAVCYIPIGKTNQQILMDFWKAGKWAADNAEIADWSR